MLKQQSYRLSPSFFQYHNYNSNKFYKTMKLIHSHSEKCKVYNSAGTLNNIWLQKTSNNIWLQAQILTEINRKQVHVYNIQYVWIVILPWSWNLHLTSFDLNVIQDWRRSCKTHLFVNVTTTDGTSLLNHSTVKFLT